MKRGSPTEEEGERSIQKKKEESMTISKCLIKPQRIIFYIYLKLCRMHIIKYIYIYIT